MTRALALICLALAIAGCGRGPAAPAYPKDYQDAQKQIAGLWALNRWQPVFAACEAAFRNADQERNAGRAIWAMECLAESASRLGKPALALPHYERLFAAYAANLRTASGRHRLANNHGVLLIEGGQREKGIARLREAMGAHADSPYHIDSGFSAPARALMVRNLARALYGSASDPAVREWVDEQGEYYRATMERNRQAVHLGMGSAAALDALSTIGRRQANVKTPAWDAMVREWEPLEEEIARDAPQKVRACENLPLRDVMMEVCMLELKPSP